MAKKTAKKAAPERPRSSLVSVGYRLPQDVIDLLDRAHAERRAEALDRGVRQSASFSELVAEAIRKAYGKTRN